MAKSSNPDRQLLENLITYCGTISKLNRARNKNIPLAEAADRRKTLLEAERITTPEK